MTEETAKHPGGRPTNYSDELVAKALDYVENFKVYDHMIPSIAGLAKVINRNRSTMYTWSDENNSCYHPEFSDILSRIKEAQECELLNNGLSGDFNAAITKLVLGKHGYHDKQDLDAAVSAIVTTKTLQVVGVEPHKPGARR